MKYFIVLIIKFLLIIGCSNENDSSNSSKDHDHTNNEAILNYEYYTVGSLRIYTDEGFTHGNLYATLDNSKMMLDNNDDFHFFFNPAFEDYLAYLSSEQSTYPEILIDNLPNFFPDSAVIDSNNKFHLISNTNGILYRTNKNITWEDIRLVDNINTDSLTIDIDSFDNIYVGYLDKDSNTIKYMTNKSGSWVTEEIDNSTNVKDNIFLKLDKSDFIHIIYIDKTEKNIKYVTNKNGTWETEEIETIYNGMMIKARKLRFDIDLNSNAHILVYDGNIIYLTNNSGDWEFSDPDPDNLAVENFRIKVDKHFNVHIGFSFSKIDYTSLIYCTNKYGKWEKIKFYCGDTDMDVGYNINDLSIDSNGNVNILHSYYWIGYDWEITTPFIYNKSLNYLLIIFK